MYWKVLYYILYWLICITGVMNKMKLKMSIRDEQYEEYSVKRKKKKKTSTKESCLLHCHEDFDFNDIVKFSETSLSVSLQLVLKACVKRHFCLTWNLLKEVITHNFNVLITFRLQRKLPKFVKTMCFRQKQYQSKVVDIIKIVINRIQILRLLWNFDPHLHQI